MTDRFSILIKSIQNSEQLIRMLFFYDFEGESFDATRASETELLVIWKDRSVKFSENGISVVGCREISFNASRHLAKLTVGERALTYNYGDRNYFVNIDCGVVTKQGDIVNISSENGKIELSFTVEK